MPEFDQQKDKKTSSIFESSGSKMYIDFYQRVQNSAGYKIPRNTGSKIILDQSMTYIATVFTPTRDL